ncbi:hypothetical protein J6590_032205 [Homalodisca vitripennis]|nr:hypothetical protein J6590_032205 [Homalodisca vitripennis]
MRRFVLLELTASGIPKDFLSLSCREISGYWRIRLLEAPGLLGFWTLGVHGIWGSLPWLLADPSLM